MSHSSDNICTSCEDHSYNHLLIMTHFASEHWEAWWPWLEFCTGAGAVKSRRKTAGVPRERKERPPFIPRECRERDWLLRVSRGTGSKRRSPPAGPGVTPGSLVGLLLLLFGLYLPLSLYLSCFRFSVHFRQFLNEYVSYVRTFLCSMIWTTYLVHSWRWPWPF